MGIIAPSPLADSHNIADFDCGQTSLNEWLRTRAIGNERTGASRTFVVCNDNTVIGYYSLAVGAIAREEASGKVRRNMPDPIPVMILGRLAVDRQWQNHCIGAGMLKDAIQRTLAVSEQAGIRALFVHTLTEEAKSFYVKHGFHESRLTPLTLMVTLEEIRASLSPPPP